MAVITRSVPPPGRPDDRPADVPDLPGVPDRLAAAAAVVWRLIVVGAGLVLLGVVLSRLLVVVLPIAVAVLLSAMFAPLAAVLRRRGWPATAAAAVVVVGGVAFIVAAFSLIGIVVADEAGSLGDSLRDAPARIEQLLAGGPFAVDPGTIDRASDRGLDELRANATGLGSGAVAGALLVSEVLAAALLTAFLVFFFVRDGAQMSTWLIGRLPMDRRDRARRAGEVAWATLRRYVLGIVFVGVVDAVFIGLGLLVLGVPLVAPLTLLTFLGAFVPIVGAFVAGLLAVLVALVSQGPVTALIVLAIVVAVQQIEGNVLYPLVVGRSLGLHPVVTLLAVAVGGVVAGIPGALVAVPIAAVVAKVWAAPEELPVAERG